VRANAGIARRALIRNNDNVDKVVLIQDQKIAQKQTAPHNHRTDP
jgi:hypothetical protein